MKKLEETAEQMELDGASDEEILEFLNSEPEESDREYSYDSVPKWIPAIVWLAQIIGVILFVTGIVARF